MNASQKKVLQYLGEAAGERDALVRVLQSQIAMTPRGAYRTALDQHLRQTREHAERLAGRRRELGQGGNPLAAAVGAVESVAGQALAIGKAPFDLLRGSGGEEKVLKNAKDACASEALEIATYTAIERLARAVGDDDTAQLAASIRADEEKMLQRVLREIPKLTDAVVRAEVKGDPSFEVSTTGAADAVREAGKAANSGAPPAARQAHRPPGSQGAGRRPGRGRAEGRRGVGGRPRDRALRQAHGGGDHRQAGRALPDRPGQGRRVRAQAPEPQPRSSAASARSAARSRGRATTS